MNSFKGAPLNIDLKVKQKQKIELNKLQIQKKNRKKRLIKLKYLIYFFLKVKNIT